MKNGADKPCPHFQDTWTGKSWSRSQRDDSNLFNILETLEPENFNLVLQGDAWLEWVMFDKSFVCKTIPETQDVVEENGEDDGEKEGIGNGEKEEGTEKKAATWQQQPQKE